MVQLLGHRHKTLAEFVTKIQKGSSSLIYHWYVFFVKKQEKVYLISVINKGRVVAKGKLVTTNSQREREQERF
jgi:hypothetical protein